MDKLEEKLKNVNYGILIYNEMESGEFEYNNKKYGLLWEHKGNNIIEEKRKCLNCLECNNNTYIDKIKILKLKKEIEQLSKEINEMIDKYENHTITKNKNQSLSSRL